MPLPLIAFSHVPWTSAFRRPQHLLRRLARKRQVYYFEAPVLDAEAEAGIRCYEGCPNLKVMRPHSGQRHMGFNLGQLLAMAESLSLFLSYEGIAQCDVWTNTPMMQPLLDYLNPHRLVYDLNYGPEPGHDDAALWTAFEAELTERADVIFASSAVASQRWKDMDGRLRPLEGSVDLPHFFFAEGEQIRSRPRIGFAGTLDHRVDYALVDLVASEFPHCDVTLAGPMTPGGQVTIPRRNNISYHGAIAYDLLPGFMKTWSVGLMPYLEGGATERNDVAKVGEYHASGLPVVSTASNLVPHKGEASCVASSPGDFLEACERMLWKGGGDRERRIRAGYDAIAHSSWDRAADTMGYALDCSGKEVDSLTPIPLS